MRLGYRSFLMTYILGFVDMDVVKEEPCNKTSVLN